MYDLALIIFSFAISLFFSMIMNVITHYKVVQEIWLCYLSSEEFRIEEAFLNDPSFDYERVMKLHNEIFSRKNVLKEITKSLDFNHVFRELAQEGLEPFEGELSVIKNPNELREKVKKIKLRNSICNMAVECCVIAISLLLLLYR